MSLAELFRQKYGYSLCDERFQRATESVILEDFLLGYAYVDACDQVKSEKESEWKKIVADKERYRKWREQHKIKLPAQLAVGKHTIKRINLL